MSYRWNNQDYYCNFDDPIDLDVYRSRAGVGIGIGSSSNLLDSVDQSNLQLSGIQGGGGGGGRSLAITTDDETQRSSNRYTTGGESSARRRLIHTTMMSQDAYGNDTSSTTNIMNLKSTKSTEVSIVIENAIRHGTNNPKIREKTKASNIPTLLLTIGNYKVESRGNGHLVTKIYFAKHKLIWEILEGPLKRKIEISWSDIVGINADKASGTLIVELNQPPLFAKELNPTPGKHTQWEETTDFTGREANINLKHMLKFLPGVLDHHYDKLLESDQRLLRLSRSGFVTDSSPYFNTNVVNISHCPLPSVPTSLHPHNTISMLPSHMTSTMLSSVPRSLHPQTTISMLPSHVTNSSMFPPPMIPRTSFGCPNATSRALFGCPSTNDPVTSSMFPPPMIQRTSFGCPYASLDVTSGDPFSCPSTNGHVTSSMFPPHVIPRTRFGCPYASPDATSGALFGCPSTNGYISGPVMSDLYLSDLQRRNKS